VKESQRIAKRTRLLANEFISQGAEKAVESSFKDAPDSSLFVLDTNSAPISKSQRRKEAVLRKKELKFGKSIRLDKLSKSEELAVSSIISKHQSKPGELNKIANEGKKRVFPPRKTSRVGGAGTRVLEDGKKFDLWADIESTASKSKSLKKTEKSGEKRSRTVEFHGKQRPTIAVEVAHPGQSYNPDTEFHQEALGEALAIEIRRTEAEVELRTPAGGGQMSAETKAVLTRNNDDDSSSDEDISEDDVLLDRNKMKKRVTKLTRSQRNKQRRLHLEEAAAAKRKKEKRLLAELTDSVAIGKQLKREERKLIAIKETKKKLMEIRDQEPLGANIYERLANKDIHRTPTFPIALSIEISGTPGDESGPTSTAHSLRLLQTKGSLLKERLESLADRKFASKRTILTKKVIQGKRRKKIKSKGGRVGEYLLV